MPDEDSDRDVRWTMVGEVILIDNEAEVAVSIEEQYEIIDPELPYEERFRTLRNVLKVRRDDGDGMQLDLTASDSLELAAMFLGFGRRNVVDIDPMDPPAESAT